MTKHWKRGLALMLALVISMSVVLFSGCGFSDWEKYQYPREYSDIVSQEARDNGLEEALVYAVIKAESNFDADAVSRVGAVGLMQLMPDTFRWMLYREGNTELTTDDMTDPAINIRYGCHYLAYLSSKYTALKTIAAAYNAGDGAVDGWLEDPSYSDDGVNLKEIPYPETASYAEKIEKNYAKYKELYS
ncbi:MAG: lytic transglycosylase domain-containing protein [Oscillospiraceae bacterium]|nr:lytic transglycosylase domain-containing protein [Oscillospiraceae bacterium]